MNGDKEKEKLKTEYFGVGDLEVSNNDKYLGYSLDLKGSEYYTIYLRDIKTNEIISKEITETSGGITFSLDDKYIFYSKLDNNHRARKIYRHKIGNYDDNDELIFEGPEAEAKSATALIINMMETAADPVLKLAVPIVAKAGIADSWADAH